MNSNISTTYEQDICQGCVYTQTIPLQSVDGFIAFDLPDVAVSGGGTRLASDVSSQEAMLLARAMTYKLAILGLRVGGAKIVLRAQDTDRNEVLARFRREIAPILATGRLMTGPDLGTTEADFAGLPTPGGSDGIAATGEIDGIPTEEYLTGYAAAAAIGAAVSPSTGDLQNCRITLEGFGKIASGVARHVTRRGGRIVAISTIEGCAIACDPAGFDIQMLLDARTSHGDALIHHIGGRTGPRDMLWGVEADVIVPGARPGILDESRAAGLHARYVVPIANAPYTARGLAVLQQRGIVAHADFVVSAGGAMAYLHPDVSRARSIEEALSKLERLMHDKVSETMCCHHGPYAEAVRLAQTFLASWRPANQPLPVPPLT